MTTDPAELVKLAPCPFCGKPPILDEHPPSPGDDDSFTVIRCSSCGFSKEWNYTESAARWWNTRAAQQDVRDAAIPQLKWTDPASANDYCRYDHCYADTPFGRFQIEWKSWKKYPGFSVEGPGEFFSSANTLDDAKQDAQKHLEAAIQKLMRGDEQ